MAELRDDPVIEVRDPELADPDGETVPAAAAGDDQSRGDDLMPVDGEQAAGGFEFDMVRPSRVGAFWSFALLAAMGLLLGLLATPAPVWIAGWVLLVLGAVMAVRQLAVRETL